MYGDSNATGGYGDAQALLVVIVALAIAGTAGLYALGLRGSLVGVSFVALLVGLTALAWPLFGRTYPHREGDAET
ncbi:hypothetical protein [Natrononativus amylolyticus]|uniref:hypothetical protein n=1 Tax=Natrononativus amylolyticus TaxID=2963434 RepID=UPI0020CCE9F3|nr:hypothetical protein [Natrononativus amylolyticus]